MVCFSNFFFMARCSALMLLTLGAAAAFSPAPRMFSVKRRSHTRQCADLRMHHVRIQRVCVYICVCVCIYISSWNVHIPHIWQGVCFTRREAVLSMGLGLFTQHLPLQTAAAEDDVIVSPSESAAPLPPAESQKASATALFSVSYKNGHSWEWTSMIAP